MDLPIFKVISLSCSFFKVNREKWKAPSYCERFQKSWSVLHLQKFEYEETIG